MNVILNRMFSNSSIINLKICRISMVCGPLEIIPWTPWGPWTPGWEPLF